MPETLSQNIPCRSRSMQQRGKQSGKVQDEFAAMESKKYDEQSQKRNPKSSNRKKTALQEMRARVEAAINANHLLEQPIAPNEQDPKNISIWGVPLLPSTGHQGTDVVLLKFLKARHYKVNEAFEMLQSTVEWRRQYMADEMLGEKLGLDSEKATLVSSRDREGRPLMFFDAGMGLEGRDRCSETEKEEEMIRCRVRYMEMAIKELKFEGGGADSVVQITDLKNSPNLVGKEMSSFSTKAWELLQQHYPELIHKRIVVNAPFWYYVSQSLCLSSRMRSSKAQGKIVFARPSKETKTLLKFISPENLPVEYGGLKRENDEEFCLGDKASGLIVRAEGRGLIQIPVHQVGVTIIWEVTVVGWEVLYKEEFVPEDEGSYNVLLREEAKENNKRGRNSSSSSDNVIRNSFYIREPGHILITIDNGTAKRKSVFYRHKTKVTTLPMCSN